MDFEWVMSGEGRSSDDQIRPSVDINILVVDDDSTTLAIVASILQIFNYKVETAKNPLDALATLRMQTGVFDLVLTDLHMPYMNGFELQQQVRKEFKLPVIMMSADDDDSVMHQSLKKGIVLFIPKPVNPEDLKDVWQFALRTKKGKSVVIEETPRTPIAPLLIDLGDDYDDNPGHQSLSGPVSSSSDNARASGAKAEAEAEAEAAAAVGAGALIPTKQPGNKRGNRSPPPRDGNKKGSGSTSSKKACCRSEIMLIDAPAGRRSRPRRPKVVWTNSLHNRFLLAIKHLSFDKAVPKKILEFMNVPGLTRENVASHLQKYRLFLKRVAENTATGRLLAERIWQRSGLASGYPIKRMLQTALQLYPQLPGRPSQPLLLPPPPQPPSQYQLNNNNNSSIPSSIGPVGIPTLLTNNQPAPANVVQQPVLVGVTTATAGKGVAATVIGYNSNGLVNHGGNNGVVGGVNPMQAWQQQNQARVGPFAGTNYPSNSNVGSPNNYLAPNNPAGANMISGNMAGYNQIPARGGVPNGINGIGGGRLIGTTNCPGLNGNMMDGANFGYGQVGIGSFSGGVSDANNPLVAAQAPLVLPNNNYQQQNAIAALPPPPPPVQHLQLGRLTNFRGGNFNNNSNDAENEVAHVAENNDPAFGSGGVFLDQNNVLPPSNYQALIDEIPCDLSDISFEEVDQNDQVNAAPTTQVQNHPDPFAAGPSRVQENAPNPDQSLGLQQLRVEDLVDPLRLMNIENLPHEIDWDALMDALLRDDFAPEHGRE